MKKILLGTAVILLLLTGCNEEKKTAIQTQATQEVKKDEATTTPVQTPAAEVKKEETK